MATSAFLIPCQPFSRCSEPPPENTTPTSTSASSIASLRGGGATFLGSRPGSKEFVGCRLHLRPPPTHCAGRAKALVVEAAKRVRSVRSLLLSSTLIAEDGKADQVVNMCQHILDWGREKQKDPQSGIMQFDCYTDTFEKDVYHFMEVYDSFQSMSNCRACEEHQKFVHDVRPLLKEPIALVAYEYKDGQIGHALNPIGPKGEGGLDDATGQSKLGSKPRKKDASPSDSNGSVKPEDDDTSASSEEEDEPEEENFFTRGLKKLFAGRK